jgi:autotransporter-associated beta strand protein
VACSFGPLTCRAALVVLAGDNTYAGHDNQRQNVPARNGGAMGGIIGDVTDNGTLAFDRRDMMSFAGMISGSGAGSQIGSGTTVLTADNPYTGGKTVSAD